MPQLEHLTNGLPSSQKAYSWPLTFLFLGPQRLPFPSGYKRQREFEEEEDDDEYDSEMEDFIEDEGEPQEEISRHIREIFGYDRKK